MFAPALLLVLAQSVGTGARPMECAPLETATAANVWERAKSPALRRYCDLLAGGAAKLAAGNGAEEAREALAIADAAAQALPGRAAPGVLRGRALERLGRWGEAIAALGDAKGRDDRALDDPAALLAWGRALGRTGRPVEAEAALRALLPRASSLPPSERGAAEIEAALLAESRGPAALEEAIAMLRQARRDARDAVQSAASMALGLALDRAGQREESRVVVAGVARGDPRTLVADVRVRDALADAGALAEADALVAIALDAVDPSSARAAWGRYLAGAGGTGPWADHARAHEAAATHGKRAAR